MEKILESIDQKIKAMLGSWKVCGKEIRIKEKYEEILKNFSYLVVHGKIQESKIVRNARCANFPHHF